MQVMPGNPFLPSLLHQQFLARGLASGVASVPASGPAPTTPPSSEDNMSPPPAIFRCKEDESIVDKVREWRVLDKLTLVTDHFLFQQINPACNPNCGLGCESNLF